MCAGACGAKKEGLGCLGAGVTGSCDSGLLQEQQAHISAETPLQTLGKASS